MNLLYTPLIGFPMCVTLMTIGLLLCCTIIGIPVGLACFALGNRVLTIK